MERLGMGLRMRPDLSLDVVVMISTLQLHDCVIFNLTLSVFAVLVETGADSRQRQVCPAPDARSS